MKTLLTLVFVVLLTPSLNMAQEHTPRAPRPTTTAPVAETWIRYHSPAGRYTVLLPAQPTLTTQESATADGVKFTQYLANSASPTAVCLTGYFDQVPGSVFNFDNARDGMVRAIKGTLQKESAISLGGSSGRELLVSANLDGTDATFRVRLYHVGTRIYVLQFISEARLESPQIVREANKYFDSFSVDVSPEQD